MRTRWIGITAGALLLAASGCGDDGSGPSGSDGGGVADTGTGTPDTGAADTGTADTGTPPSDAGGSDAGPPADPSAAGPYTVTTTSADVASGDRTVPAVAYVPVRDGGRSPLLVFHPGFQVSSEAYGALCEHVASHGFVVVRADPPSNSDYVGSSHVEGAEDMSAVIDWALSTFAAALDADHVAASGHSVGGKVAAMVAHDDERVTALVGIDPVNGSGGPGSSYNDDRPDIVPDWIAPLSIPVAFLGETTDSSGGLACAPADQSYQTFYEAATAAPWAAELTFTGARHMDFLTGPGSCGTPCFACMQSGMADAVAAKATTVVTAFARRHLLGDAAMESWLTGADVPDGIDVRSR